LEKPSRHRFNRDQPGFAAGDTQSVAQRAAKTGALDHSSLTFENRVLKPLASS
jgi:hypothetical protein